MTSDPRKAPVRIRIRPLPTAGFDSPQERLVVQEASPARRRRQPNSGSMKPGETRNPNGRPKGAKGTRAIVRKVLGAKTTIREKGRPRTVSIYEALVLKELQLASEGDWRARKTVFELGRWAMADENLATSGSSTPASNASSRMADQAILAWFEEEAARRRSEEGDQ